MPDGYHGQAEYELFKSWFRSQYGRATYEQYFAPMEGISGELMVPGFPQEMYDYWRRTVYPQMQQQAAQTGEYKYWLRGFIQREGFSREQATDIMRKAIEQIQAYGVGSHLPYYDVMKSGLPSLAAYNATRAAVTGGKPMPEQGGYYLPSGAYMTPQGEYIPSREGISPTGGITSRVGPLAFGGTKGIQGQRLTPSQWEAQTRASLKSLPSAGVTMSEYMKGRFSPAMQSYFMSQFPFIFGEKFGGEETRQAWQMAIKQQQAKAAKAAGTRKSQQWVLGKKGEYLSGMGAAPPSVNPYLASYLKTAGRISTARRQEATAKTRAGRIQAKGDPWERFLAQYPYLEEFIRIPAGQRGFFPARFRPMTRWL